MNLIEELRKYDDYSDSYSHYSSTTDKVRKFRDTVEELEACPIVHSEFEDMGRWSNYKIKVYKVETDSDIAYFEYGKEEPATESQEGMDLSFHFKEVFPREKTIIVYE